jgi:predicted DNA-binding transcriptional regulator AlpA
MDAQFSSTSEFMTLMELRSKLGISRSLAYELARQDQLPIPTIRVGRQFRFSRIAFDSLLHLRHEDQDPHVTSDPSTGTAGFTNT